MKTQNSKSANVVSKTESKNAAKQVNNQPATRRVVETRAMWDVIFNHGVSLVVAYARGQKPTDPRKGFAFEAIATQPHSRAYAQNLLRGFVTGKAGKVLKDFDDLSKAESREKIAIAILLDCKLAKEGTEGAKRILGKATPQREKAFAEAVLTELNKPTEQPTTPKGGRAKKSGAKNNTPKGVGESLRAGYEATIQATGKLLEAMGAVEKPKATTPKGGNVKSEKKAAPKGAKANGKAKSAK